ncbi:MAG: GNAT family N-acetyltransferase [Pirellulales bacterium]
MTVLDGQQMIGIVPLVVVEEQTRIGTVRVLTYPLAGWGSFYGPLGVRPQLVLNAACKHLKKTAADWDMFDLRWIAIDDLEEDRSYQAMSQAGFSVHRSVWQETAMLDLENSWEYYLNSRPSKFRSEIRRKTRRLQESGEMEFIRYRPLGAAHNDSDPQWDLFNEVFDVALHSWQGASTTGTTISHPQVCGFFRESHLLAAKLGMLDLALIRMNGVAAAFSYNYHCNGHLFGLRRGNLPEFHRKGIGTVLTALMVEDSFTRGDKSIDMATGSMHAKKPWMTRLVPVGRMTHYSIYHPKVQVLRLKHWWQSSTDNPTVSQDLNTV